MHKLEDLLNVKVPSVDLVDCVGYDRMTVMQMLSKSHINMFQYMLNKAHDISSNIRLSLLERQLEKAFKNGKKARYRFLEISKHSYSILFYSTRLEKQQPFPS